MDDNQESNDTVLKEEISGYDVATVVMIELGRIYDLLSIIAMKADPMRTTEMIKLHSEGKILAPPPALEVERETDEND